MKSFLVGFTLLFGAISHLIELLFFIWKKLQIAQRLYLRYFKNLIKSIGIV